MAEKRQTHLTICILASLLNCLRRHSRRRGRVLTRRYSLRLRGCQTVARSAGIGLEPQVPLARESFPDEVRRRVCGRILSSVLLSSPFAMRCSHRKRLVARLCPKVVIKRVFMRALALSADIGASTTDRVMGERSPFRPRGGW